MAHQISFVFLVVLPLLLVSTILGQDTVIVLRPDGAAPNPCSAAGELKSITVRAYKINGKSELRLAGELGPSAASTSVSRDLFNRMRKIRLRDLSEVEVREGILYVAAGVGQKTLAFPDVEPGRGTPIPLSQYAGMSVEAESRDGRFKQKHVIPLKSVWRMFVLSSSLTAEEALFRHAQQEASVSAWSTYLAKVPSYKVKEAGAGLVGATNNCMDRAIERFRTGEFMAIEEAKELGQRVVAMSGETGHAAERLLSLRTEEQLVREQIRIGMQLRREQKWDDALSAWAPVTKYLRDQSLRDFADAYNDTLVRSHDFHIEAAKTAELSIESRGLDLDSDSQLPLQQARAEYELALQRKPDSAIGRQGRREMLVRLAVIDARRLLALNNPVEARAVLVKATEEQGEDARIAEALKEITAELARLRSEAQGSPDQPFATKDADPPVIPQPAQARSVGPGLFLIAGLLCAVVIIIGRAVWVRM